MHNVDVYGFGERLTLESFDNSALDLMVAEGRNSIVELVSAANSMEALADGLESTGVSRQDAITLESISPGLLPENYPVNSFTLVPSPTNLRIALESIDSFRNLSIANVLKAVYRFLSTIVNWVATHVKKLFTVSNKDGQRVVANISATVTSASSIITQTSKRVDAATEDQYAKSLEKAKLTISDAFNHLTRRLVTEPGAVGAILALRNELHTVYAKMDTITEKFILAVEASQTESRYSEAANMLTDLAGLNIDSLVDVTPLANVLDVTKQVPKLKGAEQVKALRDLCAKLSGKISSWDVKTADTIQGMFGLCGRLDELLEALDDPLVGHDVPKVADFSNKGKGAPKEIAQPLTDAGTKLTEAFVVAQDCVAIFVALFTEVMSLTQVSWDASKQLMGAVATKAKTNKDVKELVETIEANLKKSLKRA